MVVLVSVNEEVEEDVELDTVAVKADGEALADSPELEPLTVMLSL